MNFKQKYIIEFFKKYREQISYLFFGVLTTVVNYSAFAILRLIIGDYWIHLINILTFIIATLFAYFTNKIFVFKKKDWDFLNLLKELVSFFSSRISSFLIEFFGLYVCVNMLNSDQYTFFIMDGTMAAKIILSFVAVIINYFLSKFFVFKDNKGR